MRCVYLRQCLGLSICLYILPVGTISRAFSGKFSPELRHSKYADKDLDPFSFFAKLDFTDEIVGQSLENLLGKNIDYRMSLIADYPSLGKENPVRPGEIYITKENEIAKYTLGFQTISWGESFGINPVNIINPNTPENFFETSIERQKESAPLLNIKFIFENFDLTILAGSSPGLKANTESTSLGLNSAEAEEYGVEFRALDYKGYEPILAVRGGYLFGFGLDVSTFFALHGNRNLVFQPVVLEDRIVFEQVSNENKSVGGSFSQPIGNFIVRGDYIDTHTLPSNELNVGEFTNKTLSLGLDTTVNFSQATLTLAAQYIEMNSFFEDTALSVLNQLAGLQFIGDFYSMDLMLEVLYMSDITERNFSIYDFKATYQINGSNQIGAYYSLVEAQELQPDTDVISMYFMGNRDLFRLSYTFLF